jgi:hypothetical protein
MKLKHIQLYIVTISLLFLLSQAYAYGQSLTLKDSIEVVGDQIVVDPMGYFYTIKYDQIIKYNPQGDSMFYYSNKLLGQIDQLDVTLALRPLIFYKNSNQIIITDNTLSEQSEQAIPLEQLDWQQVTQIASSFNNNKVWLYDQSNFELLLVDRQLRIEQRSGNLLQIIDTETVYAKQIKEHQSKLYFNNPKNGIHVFDLFGTYYNTIHLTGIDDFELYNNYIVSFKNDSLSFYNTISFTENKIPVPVDSCDDYTLKNDMIYLLKSGVLYRYKIVPKD